MEASAGGQGASRRDVRVGEGSGHPENERCDELATTAADGAGRIRDEGFQRISEDSEAAPGSPEVRMMFLFDFQAVS